MKTCSRCGRVLGDYDFVCPTCGCNFIGRDHDGSPVRSPYEVPGDPVRSDFNDEYIVQTSVPPAYMYRSDYEQPVYESGKYSPRPDELQFEPSEKNRNVLIILLGIAASVLVVIIAVAAIVMISPSHKKSSGGGSGYYGGGTATTKISEKVTVPDVVGFKLDVAVEKLTAAGFRHDVEYKEVDDVVDFMVLEQTPEALKIVDKSTKVKLVVAKLRVKSQSEIDAETEVQVPNVVGMSLKDAENIIKQASLQPRVKEYQYSDSVEENCVISQDPEGGNNERSSVKKNTEVFLVVSKGKDMSNYVKLDDYTGRDINQVRKELEGVGLKVEYSYSDHESYKKDQIISQDTAQGSYVEKGKTVGFDVASGNKPVASRASSKPVFHSVSASSVLEPQGAYDYKPENALHDDKTCWTEGVDGDGVGEYIMLSDKDVQTVRGCQITNGYILDEDTFRNNGRLSKVTFEFSDGSTYTADIDPDRMDLQTIEFPEPVETTGIKIIIAEAKSGDKYEDTCITLIMPY